MGTRAAEELLTGTTSFSVPIDGSHRNVSIITQLANSVFFRPSKEGQGVEPSRQSISGILLIVVGNESLSVVGLLHPSAARPLAHELFRDVHFVRLKAWPIEAGVPFGIEWVGMKPTARSFPHLALFDLPDVPQS
jgi:hypothetical protein